MRLTVALLLIQPDIGQTLLITTTFMAVFFMAGVPLRWVTVLGGVFVAGMTAIYLLFPHVRPASPSSSRRASRTRTRSTVPPWRSAPGAWSGVGWARG